MSFYRTMVSAVAIMGLAVSAYAADQNKDAAMQPKATEVATVSPSANLANAPAAEQKTVDINKATEKELMEIKGITAGKAKAIMEYRNKHGDFKSLDELKDIRGFKRMKEKTLKEIQSRLSVG